MSKLILFDLSNIVNDLIKEETIKILQEDNVKICVLQNNSNILDEALLNKYDIHLINLPLFDISDILNKFNVAVNEVSYLGNDINNINLMQTLNIKACPKNSNTILLQKCSIILENTINSKCVKEFCEIIIKINKRVFGKITALIGVRKGSKRVINKNIRKINNNENLLVNKIKILKKVDNIDKILVTSDCDVMLNIAKKEGVIVHKRPDYYASDECPNSDNFAYIASICDTDNIIYTPVTSPFITESIYIDMIKTYKNINICLKYDSVVTSEELKEFIYYNNHPIGFEPSNIPRSQDIESIYKITFGGNILLKEDIMKYKFAVGKKPYFYKVKGINTYDIDDNLHFLQTELLLNRGLISNESINDYMNYKVNVCTQFLDCTIRDGGYNNNWTFDDNYVIDCYNIISKIGYNYFEIGFRNNLQCEGKGKYYNISDDEINYIYEKSNHRCKIAIMVTLNRFNVDSFNEKKKSKIDLIRLLIHRENDSYEIEKAFDISKVLMKKGYEVSINIGNSDNLNFNDINLIIEQYSKLEKKIKCICLADTFGHYNTRLITQMKYLFKNIPLGFHGHNHTNNESNNCLQAINDGYHMIDTTLNGYGKNSGNAKTEIIYYYKNYNIDYITELFSFFNLYKKIYNKDFILGLLYFICGTKNIHSDYVNFIIDDSNVIDYNIILSKLLKVINYLLINDNNNKTDSSSNKNLIPYLKSIKYI